MALWGIRSAVLFWASVAIIFAAETPEEPGIPVKNALVVQKCGGCHRADASGSLSRISWIRTTPEGWEEVIKRMVRLNHVNLSPIEAREILRYLSNAQGLAPQEAKPVMYVAERRIVDEQVPEPVKEVCNACHAFGKVASWRRSSEEWDLLYKMHVGYFPSAEMTTFLRPPDPPGTPPAPPGTDKREPYEKALEYLKTNFPLRSPEWAAFRTTLQPAHIEGRWLISAYKPGEGSYYGEMTVEATSDPATVKTHTRLTSAKSGAVMQRSGQATVYQGYAWRGRSESSDVLAGPESAAQVREVMMLSRDQSQAEGRWMWGQYQEFGFEVKMIRSAGSLTVLGLDVASLRSGASHTVQLFGDSFPAGIESGDVDFGEGIRVDKVVRVSRSQLRIELTVAKNAPSGRRDVSVRGVLLPSAFAVFDHIDYVKVSPETALSRLGAGRHPKGYLQFEAIGYLNGADGKPNTADDVAIGPVRAKWTLQEFYATYGDDDIQYVGSLNAETGLFTPSSDGPNPARRFSRNNYGDVWVEAEVNYDLPPAKAPGDPAKPLRARSYMIVTVPLYLQYDQPEVAP